MSDIFADTSGWAELIDSTLPSHSLAAKIYRQTRQPKNKIITTNYIITELVALLTNPLRIHRKKTIEFIDSLKASPHIEIVHIDAILDASQQINEPHAMEMKYTIANLPRQKTQALADVTL
ncbi:hypothetical protein [Candidatus Parabeggiatoa sp. HSG14]|uniref:hypothetical protein n=1 Tax=Candidatus Parabeggiatoa sp. HSG14 TaxID=3055593 RepID=UPI0025A7B343|nr:hypothetical protein [Thiotrichales bacterium HSG14]